jgi:hypothetical protein
MPIQPPPAETEPIAPGDETGVGAARLEEFVQAASQRVVRKEVGQIRRAMGRSCALDKFKEEALEFYSTHAEFVRECMHISELASQLYVANNCRLFTTCTSNEQIEARLVELENQAPKTLVRLALPRLVARKEDGHEIRSHSLGSGNHAVGDPEGKDERDCEAPARAR